MSAFHASNEPESQKSVVGLMGSEGGNMQIDRDEREKQGSQNSRNIALGTSGHADYEGTENESQIPGILENIAKPHNRQRAHQAKGCDNAVADDGHHHRDNDGKQNQGLNE